VLPSRPHDLPSATMASNYDKVVTILPTVTAYIDLHLVIAVVWAVRARSSRIPTLVARNCILRIRNLSVSLREI
jgi:hypothetical protein